MLTHEQLLERQNGLGGSDIGAIFGLCPWKTPLDVYLSKVEPLKEETETDAMRRGNEREIAILDYYSRAYCGDMGDYFLERNVNIDHPTLPFLKGSLDAVEIHVDDRNIRKEIRVVEAKSVSVTKRKEWGEAGTDQVPYHYLLQVAHYCLVTALEEAHIVVEWDYGTKRSPFKSPDCWVYQYKRNPKLEAAIVSKASAFWNNHVIPRIPPLPSNVADVKKLWPSYKKDSLIEATQDIEQACSRMREINESVKKLEDEKKAHETAVRSFMKGNDTLMYSGSKIASTSKHKRNSPDLKKLRADNPELVERYQVCTEVDTFKLYERV